MSEPRDCTIIPTWFAALCKFVFAMDWRLYSTLVLKALLPTSYLSVQLHLLGELPSTSGVIIASQVVWLSLMFKVLQDLFIMPLYFILGNTITDQNETRNKLKTGLAIIVAVFALTTGTLFLAAPSLVKAMAQSPNLVKSICIF